MVERNKRIHNELDFKQIRERYGVFPLTSRAKEARERMPTPGALLGKPSPARRLGTFCFGLLDSTGVKLPKLTMEYDKSNGNESGARKKSHRLNMQMSPSEKLCQESGRLFIFWILYRSGVGCSKGACVWNRRNGCTENY